MEKAKSLNILKGLWMTKFQMMVHMFTSYLRSLMQLHHGNIWPIIHNIQKMKKSITLNWNPCQNEKLIIPQRFSVKLSLSICCTRVISAKQPCKSMLPRSILYYVKVTEAGAKSGTVLWRTLYSDNAYSKNKPVFSRVLDKHQILQLGLDCLNSKEEFLRSRKGNHKTVGWSNSLNILPDRESWDSALSKSNKMLCWKKGPGGHCLFWIPAASANSPETIQGNRKQEQGLPHLKNYWGMVQSFYVHSFS